MKMSLISECKQTLEYFGINNLWNNDNTLDMEWNYFSFNWKTLTQLFIIFGLCYFIYWLCFVPLNWIKDFSDVGFTLENTKRTISKKDTINRLRRLRKLGEKLPPPFPNGWFGILESDKLKPGQVINIDCLGQNFAVFRTVKNEVHVLDAYCPHLGANLGVGGIVRDDCIECPFHHWTFRGSDGQCVNVPYSKNGTIPKSASVKHWTSCELNGQIFIWHSVDDEKPWDIPMVEQIKTGEWTYHGRNEYLINCHIQEIPENGADTAHLNAVHGGNMLTGGNLNNARASWASFAKHIWQANWQSFSDINLPYIANMTLKHSIRLFNKIEICTVDVNAKQIGPGYVQLYMKTALGPVIIIQTITPIEPLLQKAVHRFYGPKFLGWFMKFLVLGESIMFERDIMIWNQKAYIDAPCLMKEDKLIKSYRYWYGQFYSENSLTFSMAKETLNW